MGIEQDMSQQTPSPNLTLIARWRFGRYENLYALTTHPAASCPGKAADSQRCKAETSAQAVRTEGGYLRQTYSY